MISSIGESIGRIWKRWPGYNEECNMDHEHFGLDGKNNIHIHIMWSTTATISDLEVIKRVCGPHNVKKKNYKKVNYVYLKV